MTGSLIMTDWQSLGSHDPCNQLPLPHSINNTILNPATLLLNDTACHSINLTDGTELSLLSCCTSCDTKSCDLLRNISAVNQTTNTSPCLLSNGILSCYDVTTTNNIQLFVDDDLIDYYESIDVSVDHLCPVAPSDCCHDDELLLVRFTRPILCDSSDGCFDNVDQLWPQCTAITDNDSSQCFCEGSRDDYNCFWNPSSRINGKYCERCRPVCLSEDHTLYFAQLIIGVLFLAPAYPMGRMSLTILASDGLGEASQVSK